MLILHKIKSKLISSIVRYKYSTGGGGKIKILKPCSQIVLGKSKIKRCFHFNDEFDDNRRFRNRAIGLLYISETGTLIVDNFTVYSGSTININSNATLQLGSGYANCRLNISCFNNINIGNNVAIGPDVMIRDSDNHHINGSKPESAPITIEDDVWIGARCIILKGVTIGKGSVVAAGSVVIRSCPPHSLIAGNPAVIKKTNVYLD